MPDNPALPATNPADDPVGTSVAETDGLFPAPAPAPPHTGDPTVDRALGDLYQALSRDLDHQIEVADTVGAALHARLHDLDSE